MRGALHEAFAELAESRRDLPFCYVKDEGPSVMTTFGRVLDEAEAVAHFLAGRGLSPGARVALLSENRPEWFSAFHGAVSRGLMVVALDPLQSVREWSLLLRHSGASGLFVSEKFIGEARALREAMGPGGFLVRIGGRDLLTEDLADWKALTSAERSRQAFREVPVSEDDAAALIYTSGTTGDPKGVLLRHGGLVRNAFAFDLDFLGPFGTTACILPINHVYGFSAAHSRVLRGESLLFFKNFRPETLSEGFREVRPGLIGTVPLVVERLAERILGELRSRLPETLFRRMESAARETWGESPYHRRRLKRALFAPVHRFFGGRLRVICCGGAHLDERVARLCHLWGLPILDGYGLTETSPLVTFRRREGYRLASVGRPVEATEIRIRDPDASGMGEVCVRGPGVMLGYYNNPAATAEVLDAHGWFRTGDLGRLGDDGQLEIAGRFKEVIVTPNGKKIFPSEIEPHFTNLPDAKEVCVFGVPRPSGGGEVVHIHVHPDPEALKRESEETLHVRLKTEISRRAESLPEYQRPKSIGFSAVPFPRSASLKIKKHAVRADWLRFADGRRQDRASPVKDAAMESPLGAVVARILGSLLPPGTTVSSGSSFELDLGMDSLTLIELWATIQKVFGVSIPEEKIHEIRDVGGVVAFLEAQPDVASHLAEARREIEREGEVLGSWFEILRDRCEESDQKARAVIESYPLGRSLLLKGFRRLFRAVGRLEAHGLQHLPTRGPYLLAPNHECHLDNLFVACFLPEEAGKGMAVVGKKEHFDRLATRVVAKLCHTIPVDRRQVSSSVLQIGAQVLRRGHVLLIHPEGTRSPDGELLPFKQGAAILGDHVRCPIIPVYIEGGHEFWPKGALFPKRPPRITVTFGRPLHEEPALHDGTRDLQGRASVLTERLMAAVAALRNEPGQRDYDSVGAQEARS